MTTSKYGRDFWINHVATWSQSGKPLAAYAREQGVAADSLRYWHAKAKSGGKAPFVAARVNPVRLHAPKAPASVVIAVSDRVDTAWLVSLARAFEA